MTLGGRKAWLVALLLILGALAMPSHVQSGFDDQPEPRSIFAVDVPTWSVGDTWTYSAHLHLRMGQNVTDLVGSITFRVSSLIEVVQNGTPYEAYNVTLTGAFTGTGTVVISGLSADIEITSAPLTGYQWIDRSDLSLIRDNETIDARGEAIVFIIFRYPLHLQFFNTGNRSPSQEDYDFPLLAGDTWSFAGNMRIIGFVDYSVTNVPTGDIVGVFPYDHNTTMDFTAALFGEEDIQVGGNPIHTYHITEVPPGGGSPTELWYSPAVKGYVRWYLRSSTADFVVGGFINLTSFSISQQPFQLSMNLDPQVVNPGGYLNVTGATLPSASVKVRIPWNGSFIDTTADSIGSFNVRVRAPTSNDNTPSNADIGSFGVLVEAANPANPSIVSYNSSTVVLLLPDLSVIPADLSFASPPQVGVPNTILAVVHESPNVGVSNTVPVEFLLDGGHLASDSTPFIPPGGSHTFAAPYTPVAGVHTLGIRVDPLNTIIESDKSNNYAEMPVNAALPDLVPWNITIHDGASAAYVDPATTGYVSDVFNASWGETWDISFEMKNTGNASAGGQIGAVVQETIDLRGPPISPPLYDAAANLSLGPGEEYQFGTAFWSVPPADGMHYFNVTVDADNSIAESSKGNNTFVIRVSVGAPDLTVSVTGAPRVPVGGVWQPSVSVRNVGDRPSPGTTVEVTNASSGALINVITVSQLGPAQSESPAFAFPTTVPPGEYCLRFHVDSSDSIIEKNETNNNATRCVNVTALPSSAITYSSPFIRIGPQTYITNRTDIGFTVTDRSGTGIRNTMYQIDSGPWTAYIQPTPVHILVEGAHTIRFNSTDSVGGAEPTNTANFFVDDIAPVTTHWLNGTAITLNVTDGQGCGVAGVFYSIDGGELKIYNATFGVSGAGDHAVQYYAVDKLGNTGAKRWLNFTNPTESAGGENVKPYIAALFSIVLLAVGFIVWRKRKERVSILAPLVFIIAEVATGVASLFVDSFVYSPNAGKTFALYVDLAILVIGAAVIWVTGQPRGTKTPESEPGESAGPDEEDGETEEKA